MNAPIRPVRPFPCPLSDRRFIVYEDASGRFTSRDASEPCPGGFYPIMSVRRPLTDANRRAAYEALVRVGQG